MKLSFKAFNSWYDNLNEPWRVLFALVTIVGGVMSPTIFARDKYPHGFWFALTWFLFVGFWALYRLLLLRKKIV